MQTTPFEIAICGAGPVGQALAMCLIKRGMPAASIALIDAKTEQQANADVRTIALSYGSRQILESASAWPVSATEIHQIHVSRRGHFGRTLIDCCENGVPALGYVARYANIVAPLTRALAQTDIAFLRPVTVVGMDSGVDEVIIHLQDQQPQQAQHAPSEGGRQIRAKLVVQAEGGLFGAQPNEAQSEQPEQTTRHHDYQQTGLIAQVHTSAPIPGRAYERFTDQGPLALLPQENGYALVWCVRPERAIVLQSLGDREFLVELQAAFGYRLGVFTSVTPRHAFPLGLHTQSSAPEGRCIKIGNAAQILHPVAGQGLNLGLRDAAQLAKILSKNVTPEALQQFHRQRKIDRNATITLTDSMARLFASSPEGSFTQLFSGLALGCADIITPMQQALARHMMFGYR